MDKSQYTQENIKFDSQERSYLIEHTNPHTRPIIIKIDPRKYKNRPALLFTKESRLRGLITIGKAGAAAEFYRYLENNIYSIFKDMTIKCGDVILNDNKNYAQYCHMINDATRGVEERYSDSVDCLSLRPIVSNPQITATTVDDGMGGYLTTVDNQTSRHNVLFNNLFLGVSPIHAKHNFYFSIPLLDFMGSYINKPIPLHLLDKPITIEFTINDPDEIFFASVGTNRISNYTLSEIKYDACISFIPKEVSDAMFPNGEAQLIGKDYKFSQRHMQSGSSYFNDVFGEFKYKYAKNFLFFFVNPQSTDRKLKVFISQRIKANMDEYCLKYNGEYYPKNKIVGYGDMIANVKKCFGGKFGILNYDMYYTNANNHETVTDTAYIAPNASPNPPDYSSFKKFIGAISLQKYSMEKEDFLNGMDITEHDLSLEFNLVQISLSTQPILKTQFYLTEALSLFVYLEYDKIYTIKNGEIIMDY